MDSDFRSFNDNLPDAFALTARSRKLHYSFSYKMLPLMIFGKHGQDVFEVLADPEVARAYLMETWERTAESQDLEAFNPEGLGTEFREGEDMDTVIIYLPAPKFPPEAYYVILQRGREEDRTIHFYTIEHSVRLDGTKRVVLGKYEAGGSRQNLGSLPTANLENCLDEIERKKAEIAAMR
jgi:hypothetical protein